MEIFIKNKYKDTWNKPYLPPVSENELKKYPHRIINGEKIYYMPKILNQNQLKTYLIFRLYPVLFIENVLKIEDGAGKKLTFKLYPKQKEMIYLLYKYHQLAVLKSRQIGWSTLWGGLIIYGFTFFPTWKAGIVSIKKEDSSKFLREQVKNPYMYGTERYPYLFPNIINWDATRITNATGTSVRSFTTTSNVGRGMTYRFLLIDEAAFIRYISEFMSASYPAMTRQLQAILKEQEMTNKSIGLKYNAPTGLVINTTPNGTRGIGKWFYDFWNEVNEQEEIRQAYKNNKLNASEIEKYKHIIEYPLPFKPVRVHWSDIGEEYGFTQKWYQMMIHSPLYKGNPLKIKRELDLLFVDEDPDIFPKGFLPTLEKIVKQYPPLEIKYKDPFWVENEYVETDENGNVVIDKATGQPKLIYKKEPLLDENNKILYNEESGLRIFEYPIKGETYIIGVDPASNRSSSDNPDYSAITVIKLDGTIVAQYQSREVSFSDWLDIIYATAIMYNNALLIIERNSIGIDTIQNLNENEKYLYTNFYYEIINATSSKNLNDIKTKLKSRIERSKHAGFRTAGLSREEITTDAKLFILYNKEKIRNTLFVNNLYNLTQKDGKIIHKVGEHDDLFMSFALALKARKDYYNLYYDTKYDEIEERRNDIYLNDPVTSLFQILESTEINSSSPSPFSVKESHSFSSINKIFNISSSEQPIIHQQQKSNSNVSTKPVKIIKGVIIKDD